MRPDHVLVRGVDAVVVFTPHILPAFNRGYAFVEHLAQHVDDVMHLDLGQSHEAATVARLDVRPVQHEEVREVRYGHAEVSPGVVTVPQLTDRASGAPADV